MQVLLAREMRRILAIDCLGCAANFLIVTFYVRRRRGATSDRTSAEIDSQVS